jgi:tetratricopeptide (TPR) repeat protein
MKPPSLPDDDVDRWHFLPEFAELVQAASRCVVRARSADPVLSGEDPLLDPDRRWRAALDWHEAAKAEQELVHRLLSSGRVREALQSMLHAAQYHLWAGDPFSAGMFLHSSDIPPHREMEPRWQDSREQLLRARLESLEQYSALMNQLRRSVGAHRLVETMAVLYPGLGHTLVSLAQLHHRAGDLAKALEVIRVARRFRLEDVNGRVLESTLLFDLGRQDPAVALLRECRQLVPDSAVVRVLLANMLIGSWLVTRADRRLLEEARELLSLLPAHAMGPRVRLRVGLLRCFVLCHLGNESEAEEGRLLLWSSSSADGYVPELLERPVTDWDPKLLLDVLTEFRKTDLAQAA